MSDHTLPAITTLAQLRSARVKSIDFHPTKTQVLIGCYSGEVILYDYKALQSIKQVALISSPIRCVKYFANGVYFAVTSDDGKLRVYDSYSLQLRQNIKAHCDYIRSIASHPSANVLLTAGDDGVIRAWSYNKATAALELEAEYIGHEGAVMSIATDPQGIRLVSASQDKSVRVWDISPFQNMSEFRTKALEGRIGNQMGKREETILDKVSMKNMTKMAKQAGNMVTGYITNNASLKKSEALDLSARVKFDPLFTLNGHTGCVNQAVWCESQVLSGGQENPYAQGCLQFIASVSDDHDLFIWDTYSRQVIKRFTQHQDEVNCVHFVKQLQLLITCSSDNSTILMSTQTMQQERTFNFGLERGWSCASTQSGASTILALGYDAGCALLRIGDFAPVSAFCGSQKTTRFAIGGQFQFQYPKIEESNTVGGFVPRSSCAISMCSNLAKNIQCVNENQSPEFKTITDDIPNVLKQVQYSPGGKFVCLQGENQVVVLSALTGKKKFETASKCFAFAHQFDPESFTVSDRPDKYDYQYESDIEQRTLYATTNEKQRRIVKIQSAAGGEELFRIKTDFSVERLFSGPLLGVANSDVIAFYDWEEGKFVTQIDIQATNVIWNAAGDLLCLSSPTDTYLLQVNFGAISAALADEGYDEYEGVDNAISQLISFPIQVSSGAFTGDSKLFIYNSPDGVQELVIDEVLQEENSVSSVVLSVPQLKSIIQVLGTFTVEEQNIEKIILLGEPSQAYYMESNYLTVAAIEIDKSVLKFKELCLQGQVQEAVEYALTQLKSKSALEFAADYLIKIKSDSETVLKLLAEPAQRFKYAHKLQRFDIVIDLAKENPKLAAEDAFKGGYIEQAYDIYVNELQDYAMGLLCAYVLGDKDKLVQIRDKSQQDNIKFRAAILSGDEDIAGQILSSPSQKAVFDAARGHLTQETIQLWRKQLIEEKRNDEADLIDEEAQISSVVNQQ